MTEIGENYLRFLVNKLVLVSDNRAENYHFLLSYLFDKSFVWVPDFPLDSDREEDGYALRNEFIEGLYNEADRAEFVTFCQSKKASCLEVLIALCIRICGEVYSSPEEGIVWLFWNMMDNLGVAWADDQDWDFRIVDSAVNSWLYRRYAQDGSLGNIFKFDSQHGRNIRNLTIWEQANLYMRYA